MRLTRWVLLIGMVVGLGCLQVAQRNAVFMKGYAVGERTHRLHTQQTDVSWLQVQVAGLSSPVHLSQVAKERQLKLVARATLWPAHAVAAGALPDAIADEHGTSGGTLMAALDRDAVADDHDTSD